MTPQWCKTRLDFITKQFEKSSLSDDVFYTVILFQAYEVYFTPEIRILSD